MEKILMFKSNDGELFKTKQKCENHETKINKIKKVMSTLNELPKKNNCNFANGDGFVRQNIEVVCKAMIDIVNIAGIKKHPDFISNPFNCRRGSIGRYIDDSGNSILYRAWYRFMCMDDECREWGQPYYAINPDKGQQIDRTNER